MSAGDGNVLIKRSFLHDDVQVLLMHKQVKILEWIAIDQKQIGNVAFLDLTEFVAHSHYLSPDAGPALQRLAGETAAHSSPTALRGIPIPSISISQTSPSFKQRVQLLNGTTPFIG